MWVVGGDSKDADGDYPVLTYPTVKAAQPHADIWGTKAEVRPYPEGGFAVWVLWEDTE